MHPCHANPRDGADALRDAAGCCHAPARGPVRIVSLVPSLTELLFDLDLGDAVVGRTAYCVHPRGPLKAVRSVGGTKTIDIARLDALGPTHVVVNIDETPRDLASALAARGYSLIVTHPTQLDDNLALFRLFGGIFGREAAAERLAARFTAARDTLAAAAALFPPRRVLYLIWKGPWMTAGRDTYISRVLAAIRWHTHPGVAEPRYPVIDLTPELLGDVDLVLFASEPFPFKARHIEAFATAFPEHAAKALAVDGQMISWYGSRAISALDYLKTLGAEAAARMAASTK